MSENRVKTSVCKRQINFCFVALMAQREICAICENKGKFLHQI